MIIDDDTRIEDCTPSHFLRGLELSLRPQGERVYGASASEFPRELIVPKGEWQGRCEEMEEQKSRASDLFKLAGGKIKFQNPTNYCWVFAVASAMEHQRIGTGADYVSYSPASVGAQVKNFQNVGGWGNEALAWIIDHGINTSDEWADTSLDRSNLTSASKAAAAKRRATEWWELKPRSVEELASCLFRRIVVAVGYDWWLHEVLAVDPVWVNGTLAIRIQNSWSTDWEDEGYGILAGSKMLPDDAVAPRVAMGA